jgi:hypothetical protein
MLIKRDHQKIEIETTSDLVTDQSKTDSNHKKDIILIEAFRQIDYIKGNQFDYDVESNFLINDFLLQIIKETNRDIFEIFTKWINILPEPLVLKFPEYSHSKYYYVRNLDNNLKTKNSIIELSKPLRTKSGLVVISNIMIENFENSNFYSLSDGVSRLPTFDLYLTKTPQLINAGSFNTKELGFWLNTSNYEKIKSKNSLNLDFDSSIYSHIIAPKETLTTKFSIVPKYFRSLRYKNKFYYNLGSKTSKQNLLRSLLRILHSINLEEVKKALIVLPKSLSIYHRDWIEAEFKKIRSLNKAWKNFSIIFY